MLSASNKSGGIAVWSLDQQKLEVILADAHVASVDGMVFLPEQPFLITSSKDNSIKVLLVSRSLFQTHLLYFLL